MAKTSYDINGNVYEIEDSEMTAKSVAEDNLLQYKRKRKFAYPSYSEQLDAIYWDNKNGTTNWESIRDKVKADNPKPSDEQVAEWEKVISDFDSKYP